MSRPMWCLGRVCGGSVVSPPCPAQWSPPGAGGQILVAMRWTWAWKRGVEIPFSVGFGPFYLPFLPGDLLY